jgi:hypothetical protein
MQKLDMGDMARKQDYLVRLINLVVVWDCKAVILVQDHSSDVDLPAIPSKGLVKGDRQIIEGGDRRVGETQ